MPKSVAVLYRPGPNWRAGKPLSEQPLKAHVGYLLDLHKTGELLMGGPFSDGDGGLVVLASCNPKEAEELVAKDPAISDGVLAARVHVWNRIV